MRVYVRYNAEEMNEVKGKNLYKTGADSEASAQLFQETLFLFEKLYEKHERSTLADLAIDRAVAMLKRFMPRMSVVYLIEDVSNMYFLEGQDFAGQCRSQGVISFSKPPEDTHIGRIGFEREPHPKLLQKINRDLLNIGEILTKGLDDGILHMCIELDINPQFTVMMPEIHWEVRTEYPDENFYLLFPDKD